MTSVTIVQPWLPQYRLAFFEALIDRLSRSGIQLTVAHGDPPPAMAARGDSRSAPWAVHLRTRRLPGTPLEAHHVRHVVKGRDLVVVEQAVRNAETYRLLGPQLLGGKRTALWGHGRTYVKQQSGTALWVKDRLTLTCDWFFAYTEPGAAYVRELGYPAHRITTVQNAIDTERLREAVTSVSEQEANDFRAVQGIPTARYALYLGGLDADKRLAFLLAAAERSASLLEGFHLVVAGDGEDAGLVRATAQHSNWLTYIGAVHGRDKAVALRSADVLINPGRVGLTAVDSFAAAVPLITTRWPWHAPEFDYLTHGTNAWITDDELDDFVAGIGQVWSDAQLAEQLRAGCTASASVYTLTNMVERFAEGLESALASPRKATA
jgi:glycosyltransferase involved in cell wall biosynthesis